MYKKQKHFIINSLIILLVLLIYSCAVSTHLISDTNSNDNIKNNPEGLEIFKSISSPDDVKYVGDGVDMLKLADSPLDALKSKGLTNINILRTVGDSKTISNNKLLEDSYNLELNLNFKTSNSAEINLADTLNASNELTLDIINNTKFSSKTVVMMGVVEYYDSTVWIDNAVLTEEAQFLYDTDPTAFENKYGNGYCNKVQLGEKLIILFSYTFNDFNNYTKVDFTNTAQAHFAEIFNGSSSTSTKIDMNYFLDHTAIESEVYSTGRYIPDSVFSREDFIKCYNNWIYHTNLKLNNPQADLSVISSSYLPYSYIVSQYNNNELDIYAKMIYEWKKEKAKINIIMNDTNDPILIQSCMDGSNAAQNEIALCSAQDINARFPGDDEFPEIEQAWRDYYKLNVYQLKYEKIPLSYFIACKQDDFTVQFDDLKSRKGDKWTFIKDVVEVYPIQIKNTIPVYQLEDSNSQKSLLVTTNFSKYQTALINNSYNPIISENIFGYVDEQNADIIDQAGSYVYEIKKISGSDGNWDKKFKFIKSLTLDYDSYIWAKYYYKHTDQSSYKYLGTRSFGEFSPGEISFYIDVYGDLMTKDRVSAKVSSKGRNIINNIQISEWFNHSGKVVFYYNDVTKL